MNPGARTTAIGFSNVSHAFTHMFMLLYPTAVLGLEAELGLPYGELLALSLAGFILFGVGALPAGWLADRWSENGMLAVLLFGMGASSCLTGLAESPLEIAVGLAAIGLFASIYHPVGVAMVVRHARRRGRALGVNGVFGGIGLAAGPLVAGALMDLVSWRAAFVVPGVASIATGALFLFAIRRVGLTDTREDAHPHPEVSGRLMLSVFLTLSVATMFAGLIFQSTSIALPKLFAERLTFFGEASALGVGGFVTLVYLGAACFQVIGGILADRFPLKWVYVTGYLAQVPLLFLAASLADAPLVAAAMAMVLLQNGSGPAESALFARYSPARWRATAFGIKFVIALGVSALGVPLVAYIYDGFGGFYWLFVVMAGLALAVSLVGLTLPAERSGGSSAEGSLPEPSRDSPGALAPAASRLGAD